MKQLLWRGQNTLAGAGLPTDVRLMRLTATALLLVFAALSLAAMGHWALRHPLFALRFITVQGDLAHNSALTLRANTASRLSGNFLTLDLEQARTAFEAVPWVRRAVVRREFPNRLRVVLQEHQPEALWGSENEPRLVNSLGEVFEANVGDLEQGDLPRLSGPDGQSALVLAMYRDLMQVLEPLDMVVEQLHLSGRGGWRVVLDSGAVLELGRGSTQEVVARTQRFVATLTQVAGRYERRANALESADLRHSDGYALRLRGVTTVAQGPLKN